MKAPALLSVLLLAACAATPPENLVGTWQVQEADTAALPPQVKLELRADGRFTASGGCNNLVGQYRTSSGRLTFSDAASTLMACPDKQQTDTDARLGAAVGQARTYRISGTQMEWLDGNGKTVLKAQKTAP
ncbi:META domain-containing protein [Neisseria sp.]|uniref:META domain-containing protein n=1 Tax=Neisseria sp. TaxID=192066 RepID=UPI0035A0BED4